MSESKLERPTTTEFRIAPVQWAVIAMLCVAVLVMFRHTFSFIYSFWQLPEYSHGFLVPLISALMLWQRRRELQQTPFRTSWAGVALALAGLLMYFVGTLAAITAVDAYALVVVIAGIFLAVAGWPAFRIALPAILLLLLMNPLPTFFYNNLSSALQLLSSRIGVAVIRLFDISVFLEGNVIDLGAYKLQVVEACSGLRYLFPLLTLGVIVATMVRFPLWMRLVIVASTVPITILMNSFRIGVIGVLVDRYGISQAEGFLHDFEGWVIFMACFTMLLLEIWLLVRIRGDRRSLRDIIAIDWPAPRSKGIALTPRALPASAIVVTVLAALGAVGATTLPDREEVVPARNDFTRFPLQVGGWEGRRDRIEDQYLQTLMLDDYILANYGDGNARPVNFYVAWYASQRTGRAAHSPASCLPGGGWRMSQFQQHPVEGVVQRGQPLRVNRVIISQGKDRQLVYYWFKQRDRSITNEYLVKWYMLWDSLFRSRSDGALVRLVTPLAVDEAESAADARLTDFARQAVPLLGRYVPD
jgi:exosortase D (VPLPA-CTERM-specific)